jgi:phosphohistidine phosphatase
MLLYLVQHGEAKPEHEDPERGLTDEGRRDVEEVAAFLGTAGIAPDRIEHSGRLRARQTAEILASRLGPRGGVREIRGIAPNDDPEPMRGRLDQEPASLMLVGHLPYMGRLAGLLMAGDPEAPIVRFRPGGVVRVDRDPSGRWAIGWAVTPELVRGAGR